MAVEFIYCCGVRKVILARNVEGELLVASRGFFLSGTGVGGFDLSVRVMRVRERLASVWAFVSTHPLSQHCCSLQMGSRHSGQVCAGSAAWDVWNLAIMPPQPKIQRLFLKQGKPHRA